MIQPLNPHETQLKELQEERNLLSAKIREIADKREQWDGSDEQNWEQLNKDYDDLMVRMDETVQQQQREAEVQERLAAIEAKDKEERGGRRIGVDHQERQEGNAVVKRERIEERKLTWLQGTLLAATGRHSQLEKRHHDAARMLQSGFTADFEIPWQRQAPPAVWHGMRQDVYGYTNGVQHRDLAVSTEPEVIPEGFSNELEIALQAYGGPRQVCRILRTATGNDLPWPTMDDTSNSASILAEATTIGASVDPTIAVVTFNAWKYSSGLILVSTELIQDSAFNLAVELGRACGIRIGRGTSAHYTTGTGTSQPRGIVVAAIAGNTVTAASATAIAADEIIDVAHAVDPAYRMDAGNVGYMMHDSIVADVRQLKGSDNNYLWQSGLQAGVPDRLYGYPVTVNQHMNASPPATTEESIVFGNFSRYIIRDAGPVRARVLNERYADTDQVGIITLSRHDGDSIQDGAFAVLQH